MGTDGIFRPHLVIHADEVYTGSIRDKPPLKIFHCLNQPIFTWSLTSLILHQDRSAVKDSLPMLLPEKRVMEYKYKPKDKGNMAMTMQGKI